MDYRFPVIFPRPDRKREKEVYGERRSLGLWHLGDDCFTGLWNAGKVELEGCHAYEMPTCAAIHDNHVFLGLSTGSIHKIDISGSRIVQSFDRLAVDEKFKVWDRYGSKQKYESHLESIARLKEYISKGHDDEKLKEILAETEADEGRPNFFGFHVLAINYHRIRSVVVHEGEVYDAGSTGLFKTETGEQLCDAFMHSAVVVDGELCHVPDFQCYLKDLETGKRKRIDNSRNLVAPNGDVLMKGIVPPEGSSIKYHRFMVSRDRAYTFDSTWPCENIQIRSFPEDSKINDVRTINVDGSSGFVKWDNKVFDLRTQNTGLNAGTALVRSDSSIDDAVLRFESKDEGPSSMVSAGEKGILITVRNDDKGKTRVISHLDPENTIFETEFDFTFL